MREKQVRLIIFPGYFLPHVGGLETHVDEFVKHLSKNKKYDITIFVPKIPKFAKEKEIIYNNVKVIRYPAFEVISNFPCLKFWDLKFWKLYFSLYKKDYDIVMSRTRFFLNSFLGMFFAKFRFKRIKFIHVEHGSDFVKLESSFKSFIAKVYDKTFGKLIFLLADKIVAISDVSYGFVQKEFVKFKREVPIIKRGVDFELYKNIKKDLNIKKKYKGKIIIGSLCRLYKWKGVENAIKAFISLDYDVKKKCVYLIVGDGEDINRLKKLALNEKNIVFLGLVDFNRAISSLKSFDIFIHSSYMGGALSNSLLQALYCKCSVVASPNEGAKEVVFNGNTGLLLKNNSVEELRRGILKLIIDEHLREELSLNSKKYIEKNFSWNEVVKSYERVFDEVLKG
ncbi:MAG: glycosyltransferase family 4 protein [Nanoarchaeota archaeon]